jgi:hypothetical protein
MSSYDDDHAAFLAQGPIVTVSVPITAAAGGGTFGCAFWPAQALRFAVLTRHRGLGLCLRIGADGGGELRCGKKLSLGGAEQLFCRTPEELLVKRVWDFAQLSDSELSQTLDDMQEERYHFHKHAIRGTLTPELEKERELAEEWGEAARQEYSRREL